MKEPINIKELVLPDNTPDDFSYEGFLTYNKYRLHPTASFRYAGASRIKNILNATENRSIVVIERSTGTSVALMDGDVARELIDKCIAKELAPRFIVPGKSFGFSNSKAAPGEPLEIKFHFYEAYEPSDDSAEEQNKTLNQAIYELHSAFKSFYAFERVKITTSLIEALFRDETAFFTLNINDEKTYTEGVFLLSEHP
jgi:hypothetical protein